MHLELKKRKEVIDFLNSRGSEREAAINFGVGKCTISRIKKTKGDMLDRYNTFKNQLSKHLKR